MMSPVTSDEKLAPLACVPMAENISPVPTTSMPTPLSNEASGKNSLPKMDPLFQLRKVAHGHVRGHMMSAETSTGPALLSKRGSLSTLPHWLPAC